MYRIYVKNSYHAVLIYARFAENIACCMWNQQLLQLKY